MNICKVCGTVPTADDSDLCNSYAEAILQTSLRPYGCPWFTHDDRVRRDSNLYAILLEGARTMGNEERVQWKKRVGAFLTEQETMPRNPNDLEVIDLWTTRVDSREFDPDVLHRAACNADSPYTQKTCQTYPWAAAARIRYLEHKLQGIEDTIQTEIPAWVDTHALQAAREIVALAGPVPAYQKIAAIQTIVAREMMCAAKRETKTECCKGLAPSFECRCELERQ
jgi:hypothetical protein